MQSIQALKILKKHSQKSIKFYTKLLNVNITTKLKIYINSY